MSMMEKEEETEEQVRAGNQGEEEIEVEVDNMKLYLSLNNELFAFHSTHKTIQLFFHYHIIIMAAAVPILFTERANVSISILYG